MVSFNSVPADSLVPFTYVEFDNSNASGNRLQTLPYKVLVIGQQFTGAGRKDPLKIHRVIDEAQATQYFGAGSMLADMAAGLFKNNKQNEAFFIGLNDHPSGVSAVGAISIFGEKALETSVLSLYIAGRPYKVAVNGRTIPAADGVAQLLPDTPEVIAAKLVEAINADPYRIVDALIDSDNPGRLIVTARHKGDAGNHIDLRFSYYSSETMPEGISGTIESMTGGRENPDISKIIPILDDTHYNVIAFPYTDEANLKIIDEELEDRFGPSRQLDSHVFCASNLKTISELTTKFSNESPTTDKQGFFANSKQYSILSVLDSPTPPWVWAAATAGVNAFHAELDPARPYQTLEVKGVMIGNTRLRLSERNILLKNGISTFLLGRGKAAIERLITTFRKNALGAIDRSYLDCNTKQTLSFLRFSFRNHFQTKFPRHKLASDGVRVAPGQPVLTPKTAKAEAISLFRRWEYAGLVEGAGEFKKGLIVERSGTDPNRLNFLLTPDLMNQLRVNAVKIGFIL